MAKLDNNNVPGSEILNKHQIPTDNLTQSNAWVYKIHGTPFYPTSAVWDQISSTTFT